MWLFLQLKKYIKQTIKLLIKKALQLDQFLKLQISMKESP